VPVERVDAIVDLAPEACGHCARRLHARHTIGDPRRHQVTELPAIAAHITEYRCYRRECPDCGTITLAPLPDKHVNQFGPQLTALIAYLTVVCRMPRLVVQRFWEGALQIPISLGSTQNAWEETSAAVAAPYARTRSGVAPRARRERRRDWPSNQRRQAVALDIRGPELCALPHRDVARV
jgi:transposase